MQKSLLEYERYMPSYHLLYLYSCFTQCARIETRAHLRIETQRQQCTTRSQKQALASFIFVIIQSLQHHWFEETRHTT